MRIKAKSSNCIRSGHTVWWNVTLLCYNLYSMMCFAMDILKIIVVTTRWTHNDNKTKTLPDFIQFDLELESGKITLNLTKQSADSIKLPLIMTQLEFQRSVWKPSKNEVSILDVVNFEFWLDSKFITIR